MLGIFITLPNKHPNLNKGKTSWRRYSDKANPTSACVEADSLHRDSVPLSIYLCLLICRDKWNSWVVLLCMLRIRKLSRLFYWRLQFDFERRLRKRQSWSGGGARRSNCSAVSGARSDLRLHKTFPGRKRILDVRSKGTLASTRQMSGTSLPCRCDHKFP